MGSEYEELQLALQSLHQRLEDLIQGVGVDDTASSTLIDLPDPPPPGETTCGFLYRVVRGDTLFFIARRFGTTVEAIVEANQIEDPHVIMPGQRLIIPVLVYRVIAGDSVFLIASRFSIPTHGIIQANRLTPPFTIFPGQLLALPIPCELEVPPPPPPPVEEPCGVLYVVQPGDSVFLIAGRFHVTTQSIIQANALEPPFTIFPDDQLLIPVTAIVYRVRPGDTLFTLAIRFASTVDVIARFNNISPPFTIFPGQWLNIYRPCGDFGTLEGEKEE